MFRRIPKIDKKAILRLKMRTKLLDYYGEQLSPNQMEQLENDIFAIFGVEI